MQAASDHHPSINTHLTPQANLSHLCLTERMKNCLQQLPRLKASFLSNWYIFIRKHTCLKIPRPRWWKNSKHTTQKGIRWRRRWIRFNYGPLLQSRFKAGTLASLSENNSKGYIVLHCSRTGSKGRYKTYIWYQVVLKETGLWRDGGTDKETGSTWCLCFAPLRHRCLCVRI